MNKDRKAILILISILAVIVVIIAIIVINVKKQNSVSSTPHIETEEEKKKAEIEELKKSSETKRVRKYIGKFFSYIDDKEYEKAYNLLYDDFKQNYFQTLDEFKAYVTKKYPSLITLEYGELERLGTYYVQTVNIKDIVNNQKNHTQLFVVRENDFNDFKLSFQAE